MDVEFLHTTLVRSLISTRTHVFMAKDYLHTVHEVSDDIGLRQLPTIKNGLPHVLFLDANYTWGRHYLLTVVTTELT